MLTLMNLSESLENCSRALMKVFDSESFNVNLPSVTDNLYLFLCVLCRGVSGRASVSVCHESLKVLPTFC